MIRLSNVHKEYLTRRGPKVVLEDVSLKVRDGEKIGILGRNGAGKSTLIRIISGAEFPSSGTIERDMSVSWPLAFTGAFQTALTGLDNLKFICRIYGRDWRNKVAFVKEFSELGIYFQEPVRNYSAGMQARLAFAISMVIDFDCFLIDEIVAVGDARFHAKCHEELFVKRADRGIIIVSHDAAYIREHCDRAYVLDAGRMSAFDELEDAISAYYSLAA